MSDYDFRPGGSLKLKGVAEGGVTKKYLILLIVLSMLIACAGRRSPPSPRIRRRRTRLGLVSKKQQTMQTWLIHLKVVVETPPLLMEARLKRRRGLRRCNENVCVCHSPFPTSMP
jgi:hypothetical protein